MKLCINIIISNNHKLKYAYKLAMKNKDDYKQNVFMDIIENIRKAAKLEQLFLIYYGDLHGFCKNPMFQEICLDCNVELTQLGYTVEIYPMDGSRSDPTYPMDGSQSKPTYPMDGSRSKPTYQENIKGDLLHDHKFHLKIDWSKKN